METIIETIGYMMISFMACCVLSSVIIGFGVVVTVIATGVNIPHFIDNLRMAIAMGLGFSGFFGFMLGISMKVMYIEED